MMEERISLIIPAAALAADGQKHLTAPLVPESGSVVLVENMAGIMIT